MCVLPCGHDGFAHLQDLKHDGQAQLERLELTQQVLDLLFLKAPFDPLGYCDGSNVAILVPGLGQIHHVLDLVEDQLALVSYFGGSINGALGGDGPSFLHGFTDLLEHEREEGDALGDVVDVAFSIGDLGSDCIEEKREAETSTGDADDGGYDAVWDGIRYETEMPFLPLSTRRGGVPDLCHFVVVVTALCVCDFDFDFDFDFDLKVVEI